MAKDQMSSAQSKPPADQRDGAATGEPVTALPAAAPPTAAPSPTGESKKASGNSGIRLGIAAVLIVVIAYFGVPAIRHALNTVSTDDAYVNSHVTFTAPRVSGQVIEVLVDDNNRVRKGDLIVKLDREPYEVMRNIKQASVESASADLVAARDQVRATAAQVRSNRFKLEHAIEDVNNQIALLAANVATLDSKKATLVRAQADLDRNKPLVAKGAISNQDLDRYEQNFRVGQADVKQALEQVHQIRVSLGLPTEPKEGESLTDVPQDLPQNFSSVRQAVGELLMNAAPLGIFPSTYDVTPKQLVEEFYKRDPEGNVDRIYDELMKNAPAVKQAEAKLMLAQRDLDQAKLNLRYCDVFAEIDGVVTRRNVNRGNNVTSGQALMAIRSLTDVWIDANFKETQLKNIRIGHRVELEVDMYGRHQKMEGRVTGFTMGTGSTLALLPAQNATGNFIKVVQRLPVRIEPVNYDPDKSPLFVGVSVVPTIYVKEAPTGPDAGKVLQPNFFTAPWSDTSGPLPDTSGQQTPASSAEASPPAVSTGKEAKP